jgi:hypothetical protein
MIILIPFFGDTRRFRPLLDKWFESYRATGLNFDTARPVLLTDEEGRHGAVDAAYSHGTQNERCGLEMPDIAPFRDVIRPGQPFDVKGALVCGYLAAHPYPTLVIDADAVLRGDPAPVLSRFAGSSVAMPVDSGAIVYYRTPVLDAPYATVRKMCAGVMWFGHSPTRAALVAEYCRAFLELRDVIPWTPKLPHLLEQYAWSLVHHRRGAATLPHVMNWNERHLGPVDGIVVNHDYGHSKWGRERAPKNS